MNFKRVLAIETSCDDTSVALVKSDGFVESSVTANQDLQHNPFGGVVPEIASRNHTLNILPLVEECFSKAKKTWPDVDAIVVTSRPGLMGALMVGVVTAKTLALAMNKVLLGVNHLEGHLLAPFLRDEYYEPPSDFKPPYLALAVSGGHTQIYKVEKQGHYEVLGKSIDDAAGEAFDKFAKMLGLGFPGGLLIDKQSVGGDANMYEFPKGLEKEDNYNYSFSGTKSSAGRLLQKLGSEEVERNKSNLCASYQKSIVDILLLKLKKAAKELGISRLVITGGVSANSLLRSRGAEMCVEEGFELMIPPLRYCTDNAAMIGYAGILRLNKSETSGQSLGASPRSLEHDFIC